MKQLLTLVIFLFFAGAVFAQKVVTVAGTYSDVVYVPSRDAVYAVRPASDPQGNTLCRINPVSGAVLECFGVGEDPFTVVATSSGDYLYLGFRGETTVKRFNLATSTIDLEFSTGGFEDSEGPFYPEQILPLRGSDDLVAISRRNTCCSPRHAGVAIYDAGRQLPQALNDYNGSNVLAYTDNDRVIMGYNNEGDNLLRRMETGEYGFTAAQEFYAIYGYDIRIEYAAGRLYTSNGQVAPLETGYPTGLEYADLTGLYSYGRLAVEAVPAHDRVYYLGTGEDSYLTLLVVDATTLRPIEHFRLNPTDYYTYDNEALTLVKTGEDASFAYVTAQNTLGLVTLCTSEITETPPPYAGPVYICAGTPLALIAPSGARQDGQGILWSTGQPGDTLLVTTPGEYSYQVTDGSGCPGPSSAVFSVYESYANQQPAYILEPLTRVICSGGSLTLTAEYYYGPAVVWSTGDTTPVLTVSEPGSYTVRGVEESTGCPSGPSAPLVITAVNAPAPAPPVVDQGLRIDTCTTQSIDLSVSQPALNYFWTFEYAYTDQSPRRPNVITVYPNYEPVRFSVIGQDFNGCLSDPTEGLINFFYPPDPTTIQYNPTTGTLASTLPGPLLWYYQDELEGESAGRFYKPQRNGFYTARVKGPVCLSEQSNLVSVTGITTATIDDEASRRVEIFPNPTRDKLFVNFDRSLLSELTRGGVKYQLYSADGKLVSNGTVDPAVANAPISVAGLAGGVYLLTFTSNSRAVLRKRITVL